MLENGANFWQGPNASLYRLVRLTDSVKKLVLFIPPLFEDANNTRHAFSQMAQQLLNIDFSSIIFDYSGTGDSQHSLYEVSVNDWRQEIYTQCSELKEQFSNVDITLLTACSGALLIDENIEKHVNRAIFWHPECQGKKFINQLKRTAKLQTTDKHYQPPKYSSLLAGYEITNSMIEDIRSSNFSWEGQNDQPLLWLELNSQGTVPIARKQWFEDFDLEIPSKMSILPLAKFWQASELVMPNELIQHSIAWLNEQ